MTIGWLWLLGFELAAGFERDAGRGAVDRELDGALDALAAVGLADDDLLDADDPPLAFDQVGGDGLGAFLAEVEAIGVTSL